jgi:hypothetical protein
MEICETNSRLIACSKSPRFGSQWIEWHIEQDCLTQTIFFSPRGLPGFLYWILLYPFHWLRFRGLIHEIGKQKP